MQLHINETFTFTNPEGKKVRAVVIDAIAHYYELSGDVVTIFLCYTPHYIFTYKQLKSKFQHVEYTFGRICAIDITYHKYDAILEEPDIDTLIKQYKKYKSK